MFEIKIDKWKELNGYNTANEIYQQPEIWNRVLNIIEDGKAEIESFFENMKSKKNHRVIFTGAGSSAYLGNILANYLNKKEDYIKYEAIATTDIVNNPNINISCSFYGDEVGDIGLYVQGDCRFASPYDVASWADRTEGSRFVYKYNCNDLLSKPEDIIEKHYIDDDHINTEGIISNIKIVGIWCGNYWSKCDELLNELKKLTGIKEITYI